MQRRSSKRRLAAGPTTKGGPKGGTVAPAAPRTARGGNGHVRAQRSICPVLSTTFAQLQEKLGPERSKVQLVSISIDPEHDRPEQMKQYLKRFKAGKGWDFLTGSREDINRVLKSLDATLVDKMSHEPLYILHAPHSDDWVRIKGLLNKGDLLNELRRIEHK